MDTSDTPSPRPRRRRDPEARKREVIEAAERVIAKRGVEGLTHRAVAEEGQLPVASTTYHFATRDDLIQLAFERSVDQFAAYLEAFEAERPATSVAELVDRLTDSVVVACGGQRDTFVVEFELFLAALRRPALRPIADRSVTLGRAPLERLLPPVRARAVSAALSGMILHGLAATQPPERTEVYATLADICHLDT
ncbi:TetR/AcrR family transcriptional regulator [Streptomyces apocyni]|uniref:TetR/AcrR family transcriptional regulator n=1 Tax=Streptomyces apocyni TaxID=2654677 RepID=UPI0012EA17DE|nr:TetR family transcriptional regulator [Streptomyces apocyni]